MAKKNEFKDALAKELGKVGFKPLPFSKGALARSSSSTCPRSP